MTIKKALVKDLVDGLVVKSDLTISSICEDYIYGKHTMRPYDAIVKLKGAPNNHVHVNVWGPASVPLLGGASYIMVMVNRGSSFMTVYFLTQKDATTTLTTLTIYHMESKHQTSQKLCEIRVNMGCEWVNDLWSTYLRSHGIILKVTTSYAHAQNSVAKQANWTILEGVQCILAKSGLFKELWAEAAAVQVYTRNLLPSSCYLNTIPKKVWTSQWQ